MISKKIWYCRPLQLCMGVHFIMTCSHQFLVFVNEYMTSLRHSALLCATLHYSALLCTTLRYYALLCATLRNSGVPGVTIAYPGLFWCTHNLLYPVLLFSTLRTSSLRISKTFWRSHAQLEQSESWAKQVLSKASLEQSKFWAKQVLSKASLEQSKSWTLANVKEFLMVISIAVTAMYGGMLHKD
jgi:hypothetical protein